MHIIAIEYEPSNARGGQERSYFDILTRLHQKGHSVSLYYVVKGNLVEKYESLGIQTIQIPAINLYNKQSVKEITGFIRAYYKFKNVRGSVIYINQIQDLPLAALLKRFRGAQKLVCHLRLPPLYGNLNTTKNQISLLAGTIDSYMVANQNMKDAHVANGVPERKVKMVPNGFDFALSYPQKPIDKNNLKLAYIGRLEDGKGVKELIVAMKTIINQFPSATLTIAGAPMNPDQEKYLAECRQLCNELELNKNIAFVGRQPNPIEFLKQFDITIFPSTINESFGRVLVESILAGVPVIARNIGATREIIEGSIGTELFENDRQLMDCLISVIDGKYNVAEKLAIQLEKYAIENVVSKIETILI